jgi:hypothetical protein
MEKLLPNHALERYHGGVGEDRIGTPTRFAAFLKCAEMKHSGGRAMWRYRVSAKTMAATVLGELLLIFIAAYIYAGTPGWLHGDEGIPSVTVHLQFAPTSHSAPLARSYHT